ncbi:MAG: glutamate racemase [Deltaproteobacteria bacterium]|nr:glutamate racemase [Deltaproteobacteria bacterium]
MPFKKPIGVFDSGVGGLSVLKSIREELPFEDLIYIADSGYAPYGDIAPSIVEKRSMDITGFFVTKGVKAVVVACNTATAAAAPKLRSKYSIPIIAIEPAVKPAVNITKSGIVGVLATANTLKSESFLNLLHRFENVAEIINQPCPGLVEKVEKAEFDTKETRALLERFILPIIGRGADTLVLGCTHYFFLGPLIKEIAGEGITIIDTCAAVSRQLKRRLGEEGLLSEWPVAGKEQFLTSGKPDDMIKVISLLWHDNVELESLPDYLL